jgi:hypothetical protein
LDGLVERPLPLWLRGRKNTKFSFTEGSPTLVGIDYKPLYDMIIRDERMYFCIQAGGNYFLYDDDFGNPLLADIKNNQNQTFLINSGTEANTLKIIKSLPEKSVVYSLKVTDSGIVKGNAEMSKFKLDDAKRIMEVMRKEKTTDLTRSTIIKRASRQKKVEKLRNP